MKITSFAQLKIIITTLALMLTFAPGLIVRANENFTCDYTQTNFDEDDGFESGEANCICQSESGYIWVGTDSGLYRYDGNQFKLFYLGEDNTDRTFKVTSLIYTSSSTLYAGTENYGLYRYENGTFVRVMETTELGVTTINDMYEDEDGLVWLATGEGIYYLDEETVMAVEYSQIAGSDIESIDGYDNCVYAIADNEYIVCIKNRGVSYVLEKESYTEDDLTCIYINDDGVRYVGTSGHYVLRFGTNGQCRQLLAGSISGMNKVVELEGKLWVLADDGVSRITDAGDESTYATVTGLEFNDAMTDVICDYEGNYWLASYRHGLILLAHSKFTNATLKYGLAETIVNCVTQFNGATYVGTDEGLYIINSDGSLDKESEVYTMLSGKSIRDLYVDSNGKLWICTYRNYGVVKVAKSGKYKYFNRSNSGLASNYTNCITELADGSMAIGTESGVSILDSEGTVTATYDKSSGMLNTDIVSIYQDEDGTIYAGSNGSGLYTIDVENDTVTYVEGVAASYISAIAFGTNGVWIGTDNGLYYRERTEDGYSAFRQISSIDSSFSISDLMIDSEGNLWICGSKGIQAYYEGDLLGTSPTALYAYTKNDGLVSSITENSFNYISDDGKVYICCNKGLSILDTTNVYANEVAPQVRIASVTVDDTEYAFADMDGKITIPADASRIIVKFAVLSYVNRSSIEASYYLEGFDEEVRTIAGNDYLEAEYTNLSGGNYTFVLWAANSDGVECESTLSFEIEKEYKFYETSAFSIIIIVLIILMFVAMLLLVRYFGRMLLRRTKQVEALETKSEEAEKANRAKNDYVNYLNREIRTPLNSILALSEMMLHRDGETSDEELKTFATLYGAGNDILDIIDGISRLSNLQDGAISLSEKKFAANDVVDELGEEFKSISKTDSVKLKISIEDDIPNGLVGDPAKVKELVTNIYAKAASNTKEGYISIDVDWRRSETEEGVIYLDFVVADTGMGVKEDRLSSFFALDDSYDRSDIGQFDIGLGLAVAYELISMMGGETHVESTYGVGTTVKFSIALKVFDYSPLNYNTRHKLTEEFRQAESRMWLPDVRVLLVDDSDVACYTGKVLLESYELICDTATTGFEAIDKIMMGNYDIVFVDEIMPVMDGADTVREIRGLEGDEYKRLPIIAISETGVEGTIDEILAGGFDDVIEKPMELDDVQRIFATFVDPEKVKEKTNDVAKYIEDSRFKDDVKLLAHSINVEDAIKLLGGKFDAFNKFLAAFRKDYHGQVDALSEYIEDDVRKYKNLLHDVRSSCANLGAHAISRKASNLEAAVNIGNLEYAKENTDELVQMLDMLFDDIDKYLRRIGAIADEQEPTDSVDEVESVTVDSAKLKAVREAFKNEELAKGREIFDTIAGLAYTDMDAEFMGALAATIADMDYVGACEIIDQYLNSI